MTVAVHLEPFRIPFGEVVTSPGHITGYMEKPGASNLRLQRDLRAQFQGL